MIANPTIKRPALRYYGGKWNLAPWIISFFPEHKNYVEPCGGAASVLLQKPRSLLETYNDLDGNVVNFFRALRDHPNKLIRRIRFTPWARAEYKLHYETDPDPIEQARRFWVGSVMTISGMPFSSSGMRISKNTDKAPNGVRSWMYEDISHLELTAARLFAVQIEQMEFDDVLRAYDHPDTLFYVDPPYVHSTRTDHNVYTYEWDNERHARAAAALRALAGTVVLSGYACDLYRDLYENHGWIRHDRDANGNSGSARVESVWLSPRTVIALNRPTQASFI